MHDALYSRLSAQGDLRRRADVALSRLTACTLCARRCGADRSQGARRATCQTGLRAAVAWCRPVEGDPLLAGAAEVMFAGCNLRCVACSTAAASWDRCGIEVDAGALADMFLRVQGGGHRMLVLSSPSHVAAQILDGLALAVEQGFRLPLCWGTGLYDSEETLALLDGVVDLYVADFKHGDETASRLFAGVADYPQVAARAVAAMRRQVGTLSLDDDGRALRGVLVRHLVLPNGQSGSAAVMAALPPATAVQVLDNYAPAHRAGRAPKLNRRPSAAEVAAARAAVQSAGMLLV